MPEPIAPLLPPAGRSMASLQRGLQWRVLGAVVALWLVVAGYTAYRLSAEVDELLDGHLAQGMALLMALQVQDHEFDELLGIDHVEPPGSDSPSGPPRWSGSEAAELALHRYATKAVFQVWYQGQLLLKSSDAPVQALAELRPGFSDTVVNGVRWRVYTAPAVRPDSYVIMAESQEARGHIVTAVLRESWLPLLAGLPLLAFAIWLAVRQGLVPLLRLGAQVRARKPSALDPIAVEDSPRELAPLIDALNQLFLRMQASLESERRFTTDAAHELRTPIAGIRAQAQAALAVSDSTQRRQALVGTIEGCQRAAHLVDQLLQLARLEGARPPDRGDKVIDVLAVAREEVAEADAIAFGADQEVVLEADGFDPASRIQGDPVLLGVLLRNLLDNALRYSPPGATVQLGLVGPDPDGRLQITVEDSGPGLPPEQLQRLGERFFRARQNDAPGSGLGWSIVRRIALALDLTVKVGRSTQWGGLRVDLGAVGLPGSTTLASGPEPRALPAAESGAVFAAGPIS